MLIKGVKTAVVKEEVDICEFVIESLRSFEKTFDFNESIVIISSKIVSIAEGNVVNLDENELKNVIKSESEHVFGEDPYYLTIKNGIFIPNAGIDQSNVPGNMAVLWPKDPLGSAEKIRNALIEEFNVKNIGVIISDSRVTPGRRGATGVALAWTGFEGVEDIRGTKDLFGRELQVSQKAVADNLVSAALVVMGEGDECMPIAIIKDSRAKFTDRKTTPDEGIIDKDEDLFNLY